MPYNPLAALSPRAQRRQVRQDVRMNTRPFIRQVSGEITRRARSGSQNISGIADELARNLAGAQAQQADIYGRARSSLGDIDTKLADRLGTVGGDEAAALKHQLELSGGPSTLVESMAGGAAQNARGAAGAGFARGSAEQSRLALQGAGAEEYAAKLPGLARLSGLQGVRELQAGAQRDLTTELGRIRASTPSLIANALNATRNREIQKAVTNLGFQGDVLGQQAQTQRTVYSQGAQTGRTQAQIAAANARAAAAQAQRAADRRERRRHNKRTETQAAKKNKKDNNPFG